MDKTKTTMNNSVDIDFENEDYTIGKIIEYILHENTWTENILSYVGFIKLHP